MAHFAKVENGVVTTVLVVANGDLEANGEFPESEASGQALLASLGLGEGWLQTSYSGSFRGNYAGKGDLYDETLDAFYPAKPEVGEWVLDQATFQWVEVV